MQRRPRISQALHPGYGLHQRHCERSEAIQLRGNKSWIASSQALLAMTALAKTAEYAFANPPCLAADDEYGVCIEFAGERPNDALEIFLGSKGRFVRTSHSDRRLSSPAGKSALRGSLRGSADAKAKIVVGKIEILGEDERRRDTQPHHVGIPADQFGP